MTAKSHFCSHVLQQDARRAAALFLPPIASTVNSVAIYPQEKDARDGRHLGNNHVAADEVVSVTTEAEKSRAHISKSALGPCQTKKKPHTESGHQRTRRGRCTQERHPWHQG